MINELNDFACNITIYDPLVDKDKVLESYKVKVYDQIPGKKFNAILIAVGHDCFKKMGIEKIKEFCFENTVILDLKYILELGENIIRL